ncbi:YciI family protein [Kangiella shandongensis]|uniref:YciI family protein n=1 Tax=Kangiella shandongensis TaxID=2763258 RepID=UPI001CC055B1|nr:YciI family protein [Kangiella shandongensis]
MKYLCLCYYNTDAFSTLSPSELEAVGKACVPHDSALKATGKVLAQGSLAAPDSWTHFVPENGEPNLVNEPYIKSSDLAGGFFIIEADSVEEAQTIASKHAAANYGEHLGFAVEVRECEAYESYSV